MDNNTAHRLAFDTLDKFNAKEAAEIAEKMNWRYHDSKGKTASEEEIRNCAASCVYAGVAQYRRNCESGFPERSVSCGSGRVYFRIEFFETGTRASLSFGLNCDENESRK